MNRFTVRLLRAVTLISLASLIFSYLYGKDKILSQTCTTSAMADTSHNQLTAEEKSMGWKLLFDGESTRGWRTYQHKNQTHGW